MTDHYDAQQVCLNGHQITTCYHEYPEFRKNHCDKCGEQTIHQCPSCKSDIKGCYHMEGVFGFTEAEIPLRCDNCGSSFPWSNLLESLRDTDSISGISTDAALTRICSRLPLVIQQLRRRHNERTTLDVEDEYDVQDVLHALLHVFFDDVRPEEVVPSYAGKSTRMDFLLKKESAVIEAKMTHRGLQAREVGEQLVLDITYYQSHPDCKKLFCVVYDPEHRIGNPRGVEGDLSKKHGALDVKVFIVS